MNLQGDFFELGPLLVARLEQRLAGLLPLPKVLTAADLAGVQENQQFTPAVHLVYQDYGVAESRSDGTAARVTQDWLAVVATRNQRGLRSGEQARSDAGQIAMRVCAALMGFKPTPACKPMQLINAPGAGYSAGFQYLPLAFKAEITINTKDIL
jgi:hypothetical protein